MHIKIKTLAWISKNRPGLLSRSVQSFKNAINDENINIFCCVAGSEPDNKLQAAYINKLKLCEDLVQKAHDLKIPQETIEFALFGDSKLEESNLVDTGTYRNALLLTFIDTCFLSIDDDIVCKFAPTQDSDADEIIFDKNLSSIQSTFFKNKEGCDIAVEYPNNTLLSDFLSAHEKILNWENKVAVTVSGIHGDSGSQSPRGLLLANLDSKTYIAATKNKLLLRYVSKSVVTSRPNFMTMCASFNNKMLLPPFFPIGRNQDGVFACAMKACLPNALIGYVPWLVRHDPIPQREYADGEIRIWRFKISEMINLLLEEFYKNHPVENSSIDFERYEIVGKFLEDFAKKESVDFINSIRRLCELNLNVYTNYLQKFAMINTNLCKEQLDDIFGCIENIEKTKKSETFCIPDELLKTGNTEEAIQISKKLVLHYGKLLRYWPKIRELAKKIK